MAPIPSEVVQAGKVVSFHYTLKDGDGALLDSSSGTPPMDYLHGADQIVPGLEEAMAGKAVGDRFSVRVPPEKGYGTVDPSGEKGLEVPRGEFPEDVELEVGAVVVAEGPDGSHTPMWIDSVDEETVRVRLQHPLAGVTLCFDVEIVGIREATADEREHGHAHGPEGHAH